MKDLEKTVEQLEKAYKYKLTKASSSSEINYLLEKIAFFQNFRLVLNVHLDMDKFMEHIICE